MIESLKNTAVKVTTEQEARLVVAIYEAAGFEMKLEINEFLWDRYSYIAASPFGGIYFLGTSSISVITLQQLAFHPELAPEWAVDVRCYRNQFIYTDGENRIECINKMDNPLDFYGVLLTRNCDQSDATDKDVGASCKPKVENSWHQRGELTPAGEKFKLPFNDETPPKIREVEVIAYHGKGNNKRAWVYNSLRGYRTCLPCDLRPIQTERDKLIDQASKVEGTLTDSGGLHRAAHALIDAGWRPTNE